MEEITDEQKKRIKHHRLYYVISMVVIATALGILFYLNIDLILNRVKGPDCNCLSAMVYKAIE